MTMMRRIVAVAGAVLALAGCAAGMGGGADGVPARFIGTWNGVGSQTDQPGEWTIEAIIVGGPVEQVGTISYPSLQCGGVLLFRGVRDGALQVQEDITYGACEDLGIITLTPDGDGRLRYGWRQDGNDATASGALTRVR
jgi:Prokaryotic membrane lipoprotein lipid attachment site